MKRLAVAFVLLLAAVPLFAQLTPKRAPDSGAADLGDVNGDGLTDVIDVGSWQRNINGAFAAPMPLPITGRVLAVLDANGDGVADLLTSDQPRAEMPPNGPYWLWMNDGHGNFTKFPAPTAVLPPAVNGPVSLPPLSADFDGDGKDDFILPYPHDFYDPHHFDFAFYRSRGDGTFEQTDFVPLTIFGGTPPGPATRRRLVAGDINGDGKTDIVFMLGESLFVLAGKGGGKFEALPEHFTSAAYGGGNYDTVKLADIDGDRKLDVVSYGEDAGLAVFFGDGHGNFPRMAVAPAGACPKDDACPSGYSVALIHYSSTQRWDVALGSPGSNISVMTYSNGALHEAARVQIMEPESWLPSVIPPYHYYYGLHVMAGKFRSDSPADLYAFVSWDGPIGTRLESFLVFLDKAAEDVGPPRRRAAGRPGTVTAPAAAGSLSLHIVPTYVDLITGRCYGVEDTFELQRDGIFASGTTKNGTTIYAVIEPNDETIRVGNFFSGPYVTLRRVGDGHYEATTHWKTTCQGQSFEMKIDAYKQ